MNVALYEPSSLRVATTATGSVALIIVPNAIHTGQDHSYGNRSSTRMPVRKALNTKKSEKTSLVFRHSNTHNIIVHVALMYLLHAHFLLYIIIGDIFSSKDKDQEGRRGSV